MGPCVPLVHAARLGLLSAGAPRCRGGAGARSSPHLSVTILQLGSFAQKQILEPFNPPTHTRTHIPWKGGSCIFLGTAAQAARVDTPGHLGPPPREQREQRCGRPGVHMGRPGGPLSPELTLLLGVAVLLMPENSQKPCRERTVNSWPAMLSNISLKNVMENACFGVKGPSGRGGLRATARGFFFFFKHTRSLFLTHRLKGTLTATKSPCHSCSLNLAHPAHLLSLHLLSARGLSVPLSGLTASHPGHTYPPHTTQNSLKITRLACPPRAATQVTAIATKIK